VEVLINYAPEEDDAFVETLAGHVLRRLEDFRSGAYAAAEAARKAAHASTWAQLWKELYADEKRGRPRQPRRTKEAIRKAKARAEGRVAPRPRKGPPTLEQRIASAEKSLATRRAHLAELKTDPNWASASTPAVMRTEIGIGRTEKSLATFRERLKATSKQP
jgi:hypothetical protein